MSKATLGTKRTCRKCNANFYDLNKDPIECPKCLTTFTSMDYASKYQKTSEKREVKKSQATFEEDNDLMDEDENILDDDDDLSDSDMDIDLKEKEESN